MTTKKKYKTKMKESMKYYLGDLDGMSVTNLKDMLTDYPDDAKLVSKYEYHPTYGAGNAMEVEYFVFEWMEE